MKKSNQWISVDRCKQYKWDILLQNISQNGIRGIEKYDLQIKETEDYITYVTRDRGRKMSSGPECMSLLPWLTRSYHINVEQDEDTETSLSFFFFKFISPQCLFHPAVSKTNLLFTAKLITQSVQIRVLLKVSKFFMSFCFYLQQRWVLVFFQRPINALAELTGFKGVGKLLYAFLFFYKSYLLL